MRYIRKVLVTPMLLILVVAAARSANDTLAAPQQSSFDIEMSTISGDPKVPRRHFRLRGALELKPEEASRIYSIIRSALREGYKESGHSVAESYQKWQRYNSAPFLSATHGKHYVNVYANTVAKTYGLFERAGTFPVGSIIAKDSFSVTSTREILLGPLFIMKKMPAGFSHVSDDWKYTHIQPDGAFFGETNGVNAARVEHCIACHLAVSRQDHLYFVPRPFRVDLGNRD